MAQKCEELSLFVVDVGLRWTDGRETNYIWDLLVMNKGQ